MLRSHRKAASYERLRALIERAWASYKPCEHPAASLRVVDQGFVERDNLVIDAEPETFCTNCRRYVL